MKLEKLASLFLKLLKRKDVQQALQQTLTPSAAPSVSAPPAAPTPPPKPARDPLRDALRPELELLAWVQQDAELSAIWLPTAEPNERQLVRLLCVAAQWEQIEVLWERLAIRCKDAARPATEGERSALAQFVALHNLVWKDRHASLQEARLGERFEPRQHERGTLLGDHITETWLPGLRNAAGVLRRKPLVRT